LYAEMGKNTFFKKTMGKNTCKFRLSWKFQLPDMNILTSSDMSGE